MLCPGETADILMAESECVLSGQCARGCLCRSLSPFPSEGVALRRGEQSSLAPPDTCPGHMQHVRPSCASPPGLTAVAPGTEASWPGSGAPTVESRCQGGGVGARPQCGEMAGPGDRGAAAPGLGTPESSDPAWCGRAGDRRRWGTASVLPGGPCCPQTEVHTVAREAVVRPPRLSLLSTSPEVRRLGLWPRPLRCVLG